MAEQRRTCAACGTANEEDARFCEGCGGSLARVCATCGVEANATARFCRGCGAPLDGLVQKPDPPAANPVRKTVTVMFADLAGSTSFEEKVDAETAREVIGRYHELLRSTAQRHRAGVTKYIGDGFMAVWGVPEIGPDDAAHAVDAGVELQDRFVDLAARVAETHGVELALRVAVNTGEVVVGAGDADLVGDALNVGARLEAECPRGRVVVGEETWRSTRGRHGYEALGEVQVKGRTAPVAVYQWLGQQSEPADTAPFVGRTDEVRRLTAVLDDAVAARAARMATVIGDPGVGKSRLAAEFTAAQADARVIEARCDVEGTVALTPIVEVLRARELENDIPASTPERDRLLRDLNGLVTGVPGSVEENFWALRRFVEVLASEGPVLFILDDIQWADTLLLDFIEHLVEWVQDVPVLVLALARPELREMRPDLVTVSRWVSAAVHLDGLDAGATAELAAKVLGATALPDELLRRLPSSTGGNPLFVRELIGMLAHDGVLVEQPSGWRLTIDVDAISIPPTIHALLASRLERLDAADRRVLEIASVVGSDFSPGALAALSGGSAAGVMLSLSRLRRLELAQPSGAYVGDEPVWRFHHVLIRDVAYRRLLKSDRADLHERLADWVEAGEASAAFDADETIARHLEAAHTYRLELGTVDEHTRDLALRSARRYAASARRALDRDELVSAGTQAARGAALATEDDAAHAELLLIGCEAFLSAGDVAAGAPLVDELDRIAGDALAPWATCYRCQFVVYTDPERLLDVDDRLQSAIDEFGRRNDSAGLAKAHRVRAGARARLGRIGDCEVDLFEALIAARRSGDHRQITAALGAAPGAALWGPSPVPKAGGRCLDVVRMQRMTTAAPSLEATSLRCLAVLEMLRGRPDKARAMLADARQVVADLGLRHGLMETELFAGIIESMEGDLVAAEPHFRTALEGLDALGVGADAGQAAALLARSVLAQGRVDEADRYASESEHLAGRNLKTAIAWRAVRAEILAAQGRHDEAAVMAREAVTVATGTDLVLDHAEACLALSRVLAAAGDIKGANTARSDAERFYAAKEVASAIRPVAEPTVRTARPEMPASRLAVANRASETLDAVWQAYRAGNSGNVVREYFSDRFAYDDRRRLSGDPVEGIAEMHAAAERARAQYPNIEWRTLAVRGEQLELRWLRMWDDAGNESTTLNVDELDSHGKVEYWGRFDEDDFEGAYRELENRYCAGEGVAFAEGVAASTEVMFAINDGDFDRLVSDLLMPGMRVENRTRSGFPDRSPNELLADFKDLSSMVASARTWVSAMRWLSPTWGVIRLDREAVGSDGEKYAWTRLVVVEASHGRLGSMCEFEVEDGDAAFAYAEAKVRASVSKLAVTNRASESSEVAWQAMRDRDADALVAVYADRIVFDDRRRLSGDPVESRDAMRLAVARVLEQYTEFEVRVLAVRGECLELSESRWSDDAGNVTAYLHVQEVGDDGRVVYDGRFDEDDFEGAYRELEKRYYEGEGAMFAEGGSFGTEWVTALNRGDLARVFTELTTPDMRIENRSLSVFGDRSAAELRTSFEELGVMVASARTWSSACYWVSPACVVARFEREAVGQDGEEYAWTRIHVCEIRDRRLASLCRFELDDEDAAFAYAAERVRANASRLAVTNQSCGFLPAFIKATQAHDVSGALAAYSERFVYDDHRRISGDSIAGLDAMRQAIERIFDQYNQFEFRVLAVRGARLHLLWSRWADDDGNETTTIYVNETDDDGRLEYHGRFEEDDFESAYRELDRRYFAGEGAAFAEGGPALTEYVIALNAGDLDRAFGEFATPDAHIENRSRSLFGDRSIEEYRTSIEELNAMITSSRTWNSAQCWLSPTWVVIRAEREAVGHDCEQYTWTRIYVIEGRDCRVASLCEFEVEDEDAAFAYAEERMRASTSRFAVANRASELADVAFRAMQARDLDTPVAFYADQFVYDDRRRLRGDPIESDAELRWAVARINEQYPNVDWSTLAVRGERLVLTRTRWSDDAGNETTHLCVSEINDDGRTIYDSRFDEDDFEGAYRELENRYFAAEGAAFAAVGARGTKWILDVNRGDIDSAFGEYQDGPVENRSRSTFPDPTISEPATSFRNLKAMVASTRTWISAECWLSPHVGIARLEREAIGRDGEQYEWTWLLVSEFHDGRPASSCLFDLDDEDAAIAYAEERMRASSSRLAVRNLASRAADATMRALQDGDIDRAVASLSDRFVYDDRRRFSGDPIVGPQAMRHAIQRLLEQYPHVEWRTLAVRGSRLDLRWSRWWDDDGNEAAYLTVFEADDDGRIDYHGRFDGDDFEDAYRELERRYYAGEGAAFADAGSVETEYMIAFTSGDLDRMSHELTDPAMRFENRSSSAFPDRSAAEFRASAEELTSMVSSMRTWNSAVCWLSPVCCVSRFEREAIGQEGEQFRWLQLIVAEFKNGRVAAVCQFDPEDEDAAFAYAEERIRATTSRLAVANRASQSADALAAAMRAGDVDRSVGCFAERFVDIDRRRINGEPIRDGTELRMACERIRAQYNKFEGHTLAVRGESLALAWTRWSNDSGYETTHLFVNQVDDDGQITCQVRYDEDAFDEAYRELDRRYYAGEAAAFAEAGAVGTDYLSAYDQGDFDRMLGELTAPGMQFENRSRSVFPDRSIAEFRASVEELSSMVSWSRTWMSAISWVSPRCCVGRFEREAIGEDGERYKWAWIYVNEIRDGLVALSCKFDLDDEDAAFAYAEERMQVTTSRLAVTNRACATTDALAAAMRARDIDEVMRLFSERFVYDDRRRLSGNPIGDVREAMTRIMEQYSIFEGRTLAVRGERLHLFRGRWANPAGFETIKLHLQEIDDDGRIAYEGRFDEDDFDGAFRELTRRYHEGEGAEFAEAGEIALEWIVAVNQGDFDRAFAELCAPDFRLTNRSRSVFGDRSAAELRGTVEELNAMVTSSRMWWPSVCWLSPHLVVQRIDREAVGLDGETYSWTYIDVGEFRDGKLASGCRFDPADEAAAFAYAEERMRATASRLAVTNRASQMTDTLGRAFKSADVDRAMACYAVDFVYDDRRRLSGDPVRSRVDLRMGMERILAQYNKFDLRTLAVRGERVQLSWSRWSDDAGNQTAYLHVREVGDDGLLIYDGRFDEDDFDGAYRELEHRYYTGEGAAFTEWGALAADWIEALNRGDFDRLFGQLTSPEMRAENRSRSAFPDRSTAETRSSLEELNAMVASVRTWNSAVCPVSPSWAVSRQEREAVGHDGEQYRWVRLTVGEIRDGRIASGCQFDLEDEEAAFAYAEERMRATASRLAVTNRASQRFEATAKAARAGDVDAMVASFAEAFVYDDRRRLSGRPLDDVRSAVEGIMAQYNHFDGRILAVRGEHLMLAWSRWSNESGFETSYLIVHEVDDDARVVYEGRFDEDDFEGAYRELTRRYCAGESAAVAELAALGTEWLLALNNRDFDRAFGELTEADARVENRSSSPFPDRSAAELRATFEDLYGMVKSARSWNSAECWLSSTCGVIRHERQAVGNDGERFAWARLYVFVASDGKCSGWCEFDVDDEASAFAYAEQRVRDAEGR